MSQSGQGSDVLHLLHKRILAQVNVDFAVVHQVAFVADSHELKPRFLAIAVPTRDLEVTPHLRNPPSRSQPARLSPPGTGRQFLARYSNVGR
ncbi:MAG: hypothetical protein ACKV19_03455, partial [Verrucomicrobiales bacterium]